MRGIYVDRGRTEKGSKKTRELREGEKNETERKLTETQWNRKNEMERKKIEWDATKCNATGQVGAVEHNSTGQIKLKIKIGLLKISSSNRKAELHDYLQYESVNKKTKII